MFLSSLAFSVPRCNYLHLVPLHHYWDGYYEFESSRIDAATVAVATTGEKFQMVTAISVAKFVLPFKNTYFSSITFPVENCHTICVLIWRDFKK